MATLSADLVGLKGEPSTYSWDSKDALLYNVGIGAKPYDDLDYLFEGKGPKVYPTFGVIAGMAGMGVMGQIEGINPALILHGEQAITLHRELPAEATVTLQGELVEVWDKGGAAVLGLQTTATDDDGPMFTSKASIFARGSGGFGGERGPSSTKKNRPEEGAEPTHVEVEETRIEQAAIYRLSGDRNPLHVDPDFAKMGGFDTPILHGLCTYGFVGRAILRALCDNDGSRLESFEARFADVVFPGDTITTKLWVDGKEAIVQAETQDGKTVVANAKAVIR